MGSTFQHSGSVSTNNNQQNCEEVCKKYINTSTEKCNTQPAGTKRFSSKLSHWATGLVSINRKDLFDAYDFGVPITDGAENQDVLMLYNDRNAMPTKRTLSRAAEYNGDIPHTTAEEATENCDTMNVVFIKNPDPKTVNQCFALVGGQYQGYHVQKWQRLIGGGAEGKFDKTAPLRVTGRMTMANGYDELFSPKDKHLETHQAILKTYFTYLTKIREDLDAILKKIAVNNSVVVMTVNKGQSDLLMNFVCSAKARGFNLGNVIVFPTDTFSKDLAEGLGLAIYYSHELMDHVPERDAKRYGDATFGAIMLAKVLCVHLVNDLGYDLLFQDVDVSWYKNPFDFFHSDDNGFDVYFQDDGNRQQRFAPYSANSGFYFVRSNDRSKILFRSMLYAGDLIFAARSHQQVLVQLLAENNSLTGLTVKVLSRDDSEFQFPSGYHYHMRKDVMKQMVKGDKTPYVFHMCWTLNKEEKVHYMKQMGMWYTKDTCIHKKAESLGDINSACCAAKPIVECHYKDKASIIPCKDSPSKDNGAKSFW